MLIAGIFEVFPLACPLRAGQMRIIAFIVDAVSKPKRGNRRGNKFDLLKAKVSTHASFQPSFKRFHSNKKPVSES